MGKGFQTPEKEGMLMVPYNYDCGITLLIGLDEDTDRVCRQRRQNMSPGLSAQVEQRTSNISRTFDCLYREGGKMIIPMHE